MISKIKLKKMVLGLISIGVFISVSGCGNSYPDADDFERAATTYIDANLKYDYSNIDNVNLVYARDRDLMVWDFKDENIEYKYLKERFSRFSKFLTNKQIDEIIKKRLSVQKNIKYDVKSEEINEKEYLIKINLEIVDSDKTYDKLMNIIVEKLDKEGKTKFYSNYYNAQHCDLETLLRVAEGDSKDKGKILTTSQIGKILLDSFNEIYGNLELEHKEFEMLLTVKEDYEDKPIMYYDTYKIKEINMPSDFWNGLEMKIFKY